MQAFSDYYHHQEMLEKKAVTTGNCLIGNM
jgi:hypothetical protein